MLRTDAFRTAGGFHPRLWLGGEEELLAADLAANGWWLTYADHLTIHHQPSLVRDPTVRRAHGTAALPWVLRERRVLPAEVEAVASPGYRSSRSAAPDREPGAHQESSSQNAT